MRLQIFTIQVIKFHLMEETNVNLTKVPSYHPVVYISYQIVLYILKLMNGEAVPPFYHVFMTWCLINLPLPFYIC
jgi:hypothetical protein